MSLSEAQVALINQTMLHRYGGAGHHILNGGPLSNALTLITEKVFDVELFPTVPEKACKVAYSIATGHVFADANKRTAAMVLDQLLILNGYALHVSHAELVETLVELAAGSLSLEDFVAWTAARC